MSLTALLALDDDAVVLRHLAPLPALQRPATRTADDDRPPGVIFVQIDGLALPVLQRAVRDGNAPTIAGWLRDGTHHLAPWTTGWSSQTGASQAGILLGSNADMPAFRWYEKDTGRMFVSNRPRHAAELERRLSTGAGLLHADGASRGNIFTGDAADAVLTMASAGRKRGRIGAGYYAYFSQPYTTMRTLLGVLVEMVREVQQAAAQRRRDVRPRVHRGGVYPLLRAFTTVLTRDVIVATLIGDMSAGPLGRLRRLRRLRRGRAPLRRRALRRRGHPAPAGPRAGPAGPRGRAGGAALPVRRPVRPRPEPGGDLPHPLRLHARRAGRHRVPPAGRRRRRAEPVGRRRGVVGVRRWRPHRDRGRPRPGRPGRRASHPRPAPGRGRRRGDRAGAPDAAPDARSWCSRPGTSAWSTSRTTRAGSPASRSTSGTRS